MSEIGDISSSSSKSVLPKNAIAIINQGMSEGFMNRYLGLESKDINDNMIPDICEWIVKLADKVEKLNLSSNQITSVGISMLFDTFRITSASMKDIYLSSNQQIDDKCMKSLGEYIKSNKYIEIIWLNNTNISDIGIDILAPYFNDNTSFKELYLHENEGITDKSIPLLMKMIESSHIEYISIDSTSITQKHAVYILLACNRIKYGSTGLGLHFKDINDDNLIKICDTMKKYGIDKLKEINLEVNKITSKGASVLIDTLKECNSIVSKLNLSYNQLDDECMKQLGEYLQNNEYINELKLGSIKITDKGIGILSEHLIGNTTLKELDLRYNNRITNASVPHLVEMIKRSCITSIYFSNTPISEEKEQEINAALSIPIEQREIPIKSNTKSAAKIQTSSSSSASTST